MLVYECCKNCSNRNKGTCYCDLPYFNPKMVEVDNEQWYAYPNTYITSFDKDHKIAVLEKALELAEDYIISENRKTIHKTKINPVEIYFMCMQEKPNIN